MKILSVTAVISICWYGEFAFGLVLPHGHHINRKLLVEGGTDSTVAFVGFVEDCSATRVSAKAVATAADCKATFYCKAGAPAAAAPAPRKKRQDDPTSEAPASSEEGEPEASSGSESSVEEAEQSTSSPEEESGEEGEGGVAEGEAEVGEEVGEEGSGGEEGEGEEGEGEEGGGEGGPEGEFGGEVEGGVDVGEAQDVGAGGSGGFDEHVGDQAPVEKAAPTCTDKITLPKGHEYDGIMLYAVDGEFTGEIKDDAFENCKVVGYGATDGMGDKMTETVVTATANPREEFIKIRLAEGATQKFCSGDSGGALVCGDKLAGIVKKLKKCVEEADAVKAGVVVANKTYHDSPSEASHTTSLLVVITLFSAIVGIVLAHCPTLATH